MKTWALVAALALTGCGAAPAAKPPARPAGWQYSATVDQKSGAATDIACVDAEDKVVGQAPYATAAPTFCLLRQKDRIVAAFVDMNGTARVSCDQCAVTLRIDAKPPLSQSGMSSRSGNPNMLYFEFPELTAVVVESTRDRLAIEVPVEGAAPMVVGFRTANFAWTDAPKGRGTPKTP